MNSKFLLAFALATASSAAFFCAFPAGPAHSSPAIPTPAVLSPQYSQSEDAAFLAAEAVRDRWNETLRIQRVEAAEHGIEWGRAGFHLLRPDDDPLWVPALQDMGCSGDWYCWEVPQLKYPDLVYNTYIAPADQEQPLPGELPAFCELSLDRIFSNSLFTLSVQTEINSSRTIVGSISSRAQAALVSLLGPKSDGLRDWFGTPRAPGQAATQMRVVLVSEDFAFAPFCVQDLLAQGGDPATIILATGLTQQEATDLIARYTR